MTETVSEHTRLLLVQSYLYQGDLGPQVAVCLHNRTRSEEHVVYLLAKEARALAKDLNDAADEVLRLDPEQRRWDRKG